MRIMKEELTREVVETLANCNVVDSRDCKTCQATKICDNTSKAICKWLATALLEEMDKPKVWDGAPEKATRAEVYFSHDLYGDSGGVDMTYTRGLPKTRARQIAEEIEEALSSSDRYKSEVKIIETALKKYAAELKGEE